MRGVVSTGHVDAREYVFRIQSVASGHLRDSLGAERVLGVDVEHVPVETALVFGCGAVHGELMADLGLSASEFAIDFDKCLCFKASSEQIVDGLDLGRQFLNFSATLQQCIAGNEAADVGHFLGSCDDLGRDGLAQFCFFSEVGW